MIVTKKNEVKWPKEVMKEKSNQLDFYKILIDPSANLSSDNINLLNEAYTQAKKGLKRIMLLFKLIKIHIIVSIVLVLIGIILCIIGTVVNIFPIIGAGIGIIVWFSVGSVLSIGNWFFWSYPVIPFITARDFLLKTKTTYKDDIELYPLSITILYYPIEARKLRFRSQLRVIPMSDSFWTIRNWGNSRTVIEFCNFIIKLHDFYVSTNKISNIN